MGYNSVAAIIGLSSFV